MKAIWKFPILVVDNQQIAMPEGAEILCVQMHRGEPCLWAMVNPDRPKEQRAVEVFGTGNPIKSDMGTSRKYIGTFQMLAGDLVFHVFESMM